MLLGPSLMLAGVTLRIQFHFFFPQQIAAFHEHPKLIVASYSCFLAGNILLWPAVIGLAEMIHVKKPGWAKWGGTLVLFGLFARTFHAGIDHLAFQIARVHNPELAARTVASSYGAFHIVSTLTPAILLGWIVLAIGAYLSDTLSLSRSIGLGLMSALMSGVLKGSTWVSLVATGGLCIAFCPLGIEFLLAEPRPTVRTALGWAVLIAGLVGTLFLVGRLG